MKSPSKFFFVDDEMTEGIDRRTHPVKLTDRHLESRADRAEHAGDINGLE